MKVNNVTRASGRSPLLFCIGMFFIALFFSVFVCSAIYYAVHPDSADVNKQLANKPGKPAHEPVLASILK